MSSFPKVFGVKKFITCKDCRKKVEVKNFNQKICEECKAKRLGL